MGLKGRWKVDVVILNGWEKEKGFCEGGREGGSGRDANIWILTSSGRPVTGLFVAFLYLLDQLVCLFNLHGNG